jgi:phage/plasmid-like protein (TIGR03299 family)
MVATDLLGFSESRDLPWRALGEQSIGLSAKEAMITSGLANLVQLFPVVGMADELHVPQWDDDEDKLEPHVLRLEDKWIVEDDSHFLVVRTSDKKVLGMVGNQYQPYQNWQAFKLAEALREGSGAKYDTCGPLNDGRVLWVSLEYPEPLMIGGVDEVRRFLVVASSHDRSMSLSAFRSNVRVTCMNTLNTAMKSAPQVWRVKHTGDMDLKVAEVKATLDLSHSYDLAFETTMNSLISQEYTKKQFEGMVRKIVPSKSSNDGAYQTQMALLGLLESSPTIDDGFRYTKYGAFNVIAEYEDWVRPRRSSKTVSASEQQLTGIWFGKERDMKTEALKMLTSV